MPLAKASRRSATVIFLITGCDGRVPAPTRMFEYAMTSPPEGHSSDGVALGNDRNLLSALDRVTYRAVGEDYSALNLWPLITNPRAVGSILTTVSSQSGRLVGR